VPAGNTLFLQGHAQGTQNYICLPSGGGFAWTFFSPQATLFFNITWIGGDLPQQIITHFLSPNPVEKGTPRATWQSSFDTSAVWAKVRTNGSSTDPAFVAPGAIPWLLLEAVGTQRGPTGGDILAHTTFVQRLNTAGGLIPATGCNEAKDAGATALVPCTPITSSIRPIKGKGELQNRAATVRERRPPNTHISPRSLTVAALFKCYCEYAGDSLAHERAMSKKLVVESREQHQELTGIGATENQVDVKDTVPQRIDKVGTKVEEIAGTGDHDAPGG